MADDGFFDRFVHPRLAMIATGGVGIWLLSFFVAASGVIAEHVYADFGLAARLYFYSGVVGIVGIVVVGVVALYLVVLWFLRDVLSIVPS